MVSARYPTEQRTRPAPAGGAVRITHLHVQNLLSFEAFEVDLDVGTTVILGPNGSGKTNLLRVLDLAGSALRWAAEESSTRPGLRQAPGPAGRNLDAYRGMSHLGRSGQRQVRVGLRLDLDDEKDLLVTFLRAALAWSIRDQLRSAGGDAPVESWLSEHVTQQTVAPLFETELIVEHSGVPGRSWEVGLNFQLEPQGPHYQWVLAGHHLQDCIVLLGPEGRRAAGDPSSPVGLPQQLFGLEQLSSTSHLPSPVPPFHLGMLAGSTPAGPILLGAGGRTVVDWSVPPILDFLTRFGAAHPPQDILGTEPGWALAAVLSRIWQEKVFTVGEQFRGIGAWGRDLPAAGVYTLEQLDSAAASSEPYLLPARLFRLANGTAADRARFQRVQATFAALAGNRSFGVRAEPQPGPVAVDEAPSAGGGPRGGVLVDLLVTDDVTRGVGPETPIRFCGAGTWEALVLAESLAAPAGRVVLLDEPAANLHPTWQQVLREQLPLPEAQALVITHAGAVVPLGAAGSVALVRTRRREWATTAHSVEPGEVVKVGRKLERKGNVHILFVERAVLVEGQDDLDIVSILGRRLKLKLNGPDSAVVECGGRENLPDYIRLCQQLDVDHLVIMDADSTKADNDPSVQRDAQAVRDAVRESAGGLFEFNEDVERAFGLTEKNRPKLRRTAKEIALKDENGYPEVRKLCQELERFARSTGGDPDPIA